MKISVIIPHLNQSEDLGRCLESLIGGSLRPDEMIVVDNGSRSLPEAVCAAVPSVRLLSEAEPGPGPARNTGIAAATGDVLAFIDADCIADPGWLAAIAREMVDPAAEILGGDVRIALADPPAMTALEAYESIYAYRMDRYIEREGFTGTGNLAMRRAVMEAVGPFRGLAVAEDRDWGQRATRLGRRLRYVPDMRVYHPARGSFDEIFRKWDRQTAHDYVQARGVRGGRLRFLAKALAMPVSPLLELPQVSTTDRIGGAKTRWRAFTALVRVRLHRAKRMAWLLAGGDPHSLSGAWNRS